MECVREQATGQRLPAGAQLLVDAALIVFRQESAGAIGALANPVQRRQAGNRLERIHLRPSGFHLRAMRFGGQVGGQVAIRAGRAARLAEPLSGIALPVKLDFSRRDDDVEAMTAAAALRAGEALMGIDA